jgi:predicted amidohydrolase YtcJ
MPRYLVERSYPEQVRMTPDADGAAACAAMVEHNGELGVTWVHSYVAADKHKTFDVYDAPSPEAIRKTAMRNRLPVDRITQVTVLDPYFYR